MDKNKKWIMIGALLLVFAAIKLGTLYIWNKQQPQAQNVSADCDVRKGCVLPNGAIIKFSEPLSAKAPFNIEMDNVPQDVQNVYLSFSMSNMDMGFNRYDLKKQADGAWRAENVRLPLCTDNRHDYLADIHINGKVFQAGFTAE
ncbi:hypothetical protein [Neisseria sp. 83E34]|uniref:hypothetical protein n=1 Tax=Neisseria sp. 83E34 TaxID=1692264 RepID=UPI0006CE6BDD|nr:hypothetical protein [Neisseria sp. 83E34]KPN71788.1 hypothetical protein AKG09_05795 [Neisseria sp. 83E34]